MTRIRFHRICLVVEFMADVVADEDEGAITREEEEVEDVMTLLSIPFQNTLSGMTNQPAQKRDNPKVPILVAGVMVAEDVEKDEGVPTREAEEVEVTMTKKARVQIIIIKTKLVVKTTTKQRTTSPMMAKPIRVLNQKIKTASKSESRKNDAGREII
mmetsp:Transcript_20654/g.49009  ORF Transcript_20654/g.49009 Transcript_20654/m.49009 type:complete len:157 (-) Transcript_20654:97-567(-)